jgi:hypothetical protein
MLDLEKNGYGSRREIVNYDMGNRCTSFTNAFDSLTNHPRI